jgi:hypothetical protein
MLSFYSLRFDNLACRREAIRTLGNGLLSDISLREKFSHTDAPAKAGVNYSVGFSWGIMLVLTMD